MRLKNCAVLLLLCLGVVSSAHSQPFDPYARVSDPRAICRLDGPDTLPVRIFSGLAYTNERDPNDDFFVIAKGTGSGILTHLWLMYYKLPYDSAVTVKIWIDDSLVISSYLYKLFNTPHGALRPPFDSIASVIIYKGASNNYEHPLELRD